MTDSSFSIRRRNALGWMSAASLGAGLVTPAWRARAAASGAPVKLPEPSRSDYDVIVIGAGFAGVTAARELSRAGLSTLVVEARNRVGGRTFTSQWMDEQIELGGTWIHWTQPHVFAEVSRYGLSLKESPGALPDAVTWIAAGKAHTAKSGKIMPELAELLARYCNVDGAQGRALVPFGYDILANQAALAAWDHLSLQDRLAQMKLTRIQQDLLSPILTIDCHNDPALAGFVSQLHWWALGDYDFGRMFDKLGRFKIKEGMNALSAAILGDAHAELALTSPVRSVRQEAGKVTVVTGNGTTYGARAAVLAVPMNVLGDIQFSPSLSQVKLDMAKARHAGNGVKGYVRIKQKIGKWFGQAPFPNPITMAWTEDEREDGTTIVVFGPPGQLDLTDEESVQNAVRQLLPKAEIVAATGYQWSQDPYAKGTWCFYRPMQVTRGLQGMQADEGALFFATSDIANGWRGFVDGAIETGLTAARHARAYLNV